MKNIIVMLSLFSSIAYAQNLYQYKDNSGRIFLTNKSNNGNFSAFTQIDHAKDIDVSDFFLPKSQKLILRIVNGLTVKHLMKWKELI
ncbi:hypothetical protein LP105_05230 [Moraxella bovis]|uniref:hypothetical protein n=1 Tax=Moraxella bovis TaxID=476 RepID=UPI0022261888|nr:hypothetical protein [Moraxella bovis]UYZ74102.1 hypothetical protein LP105_05230 [Moraxella bovis]